MVTESHQDILLKDLTDQQKDAVRSKSRCLLVIAGAGSGKTDVMARRVAWWVAVEGIPKEEIVAFTFTEAAAEELKFRIRYYIQLVTPPGDDTTIGGMYIGTIHGFCLKALRDLDPDDYHNLDIIDEAARLALVIRSFHNILGLQSLQDALGVGQYETTDIFLHGYDLLNEYDELDVHLMSELPPSRLGDERAWCREAELVTQVGNSAIAQAFAVSAARFYAYLRCRRFLDFSTSQTELLRLLRGREELQRLAHEKWKYIVVDEVQDINPVQNSIIRFLVGNDGKLTAVGDHRQAIYAWRGGRVELMGNLYDQLEEAPDGQVIELQANFRSTDRIINLANAWSDTIGRVGRMTNPPMSHGNERRNDLDDSHVGVLDFSSRNAEANWIADKIESMVQPRSATGAVHDTREGERGLTYSDIALLVRSATDSRVYMQILEQRNIPVVVRAGPDLFSQPEVILFVSILALIADINEFYGSPHDLRAFPNRIRNVLGCNPIPEEVIPAACQNLSDAGLPIQEDLSERMIRIGGLIRDKLQGQFPATDEELQEVRNPQLRQWLNTPGQLRRIFPQRLYHWILGEADVGLWDNGSGRTEAAMFHLGQLSSLVKSIETPGWTQPNEFKYQIIALVQWGAQNARADRSPLLIAPNAVTITTIHSAKGLQWSSVFLADVNAHRFPSQRAKQPSLLPYDGDILRRIDPSAMADNDNYDAERRLMYVAITRAERYLAITCSGDQRSRFFRQISQIASGVGVVVSSDSREVLSNIELRASESSRDLPLATSFSDMRYYWACPHDYYLRKLLGFTPTIDQAFGYGRGVHNLMRAIHSDPTGWARIAENPTHIRARLEELERQGLFYLRYTTGEPADNMRNKAFSIIADYIRIYAGELARLHFEPEREFETLIPEEQVLVSGAIDVIRLDDPPRVTLLDFKSGDAESDAANALDTQEMRLQVGLYGIAARHELEYQPEQGLVRYLDETEPDRRELRVELTDEALNDARDLVINTARQLRARQFHRGPSTNPRRCVTCDYTDICGLRDRLRPRAGQ
ncbi:MAG: ATP-dependent DNA helicase [Dehalococcoidales bacterium]|jgi:DNA helicase-2/ATP-dependent DNA helicase PcrA